MWLFKRKNAVPVDRLKAVVISDDAPKCPRASRRDTWAECRLVFPSGTSVDGVVLDLSATGARVRFVTKCAIPDGVELVIPRFRIREVAEVVRRDETDVGLRFLNPRHDTA